MTAKNETRWSRVAARLERTRQLGKNWTRADRKVLAAALGWWNSVGYREAQTWDDRARQQFKGKWQAWCVEADKKREAGEYLTLEEERFAAHGKGAWWAIGFTEGQQMDGDAVRKFKDDCVKHADAEPHQGKSRTLRDEAREAWRQGVWRAVIEAQTQRMNDASAQVAQAVCDHLKPWPDSLARDDYDFGKWVDAIRKNGDKAEQRDRLIAGVFYEYARESYKLRGLLALESLPEDGEEDDLVRPNSFDGLDALTAEKALGKWFTVLLQLADELAENLPFAKVKPERIDRALFVRRKNKKGKQLLISRLDSEFGRTLWYVPPVAPAFETDRSIATGLETLRDWRDKLAGEPLPHGHEPRKRKFQRDHKADDCEEVLLVRVNWRDYTDAELGQAFADLARRYRPTHEFPAPQRAGHGRENQLTRLLDNLSAMRLRRRCGKEEALRLFEKCAQNFLRLDAKSGAASKDWKDFKEDGNRAEDYFQNLFPFDEKPANASKGRGAGGNHD